VLKKPKRVLYGCHLVQVFTGPPESVRDHIMAAARALARGDWEKAYGFITALKMWSIVPDREAVQEMLKKKLKQEGLRIYLFTYGPQYMAVSQAQLCAMFQLEPQEVYPIVRSQDVFGHAMLDGGSTGCATSAECW
jgi:translation initiation factor 3 subunit C